MPLKLRTPHSHTHITFITTAVRTVFVIRTASSNLIFLHLHIFTITHSANLRLSTIIETLTSPELPPITSLYRRLTYMTLRAQHNHDWGAIRSMKG